MYYVSKYFIHTVFSLWRRGVFTVRYDLNVQLKFQLKFVIEFYFKVLL